MTVITRGPAPGVGATAGYSNPASRAASALEGVAEQDLVTFSLDGRDVKARKGETIIEVCNREDVYVPHYCWQPALSIAGNCRLCLVEMEKAPKPVIACQTQVAPGMVVRTNSEPARAAQEWMMEFLLVNHPLDCPICDRGGECQLQRYSMEYGTGHTRMADKKRKFIKPQADPLIDIERNRCIMCTRCVRFCDEIGGEHVMGVFDRGDGNYIGTFGQGPVSNIFSGNVIDICPVGCLTSKPFRFKARPWELAQSQTTCDHCASGCKVTAWTRNDHLYRVTPPSRLRHDHFTINEDTEEFICNQGRFGSDYGHSASRLTEALVRRVGRMVPTSFDDAAKAAAAELRRVAAEHGPESIAVLVSPRLTLEEGFAARSLAFDVIKTPHLDWRCNAPSAEVAATISAALSVADGDLENDPDVVIVTGGKLVWQSPVVALRLQELARRFEKKLVLVGDYNDGYLAPFAAHVIPARVGETAKVLDALKDAASSGNAKALCDASGISAEDGAKVVELLKSASRGLVVHSLEALGGRLAPVEVPAALALKNQLGWGYLPVVVDRNAVGMNAMGVEPREGGVAAPDIVEAIASGRIKGLLVVGAESLAAITERRTNANEVFAQLQALVVADHFRSDWTDRATVAFPLATTLEKHGTLADIEGNIARVRCSVAPAGDSRPAWEILAQVGVGLGARSETLKSAEDVWSRVREELAPSSTVTLADLELEGSSNPSHFVHIRPQGGARHRGIEFNPGNYRKDGLHLRAEPSASLPALPSAAAPKVTGSGKLALVWSRHVAGKGFVNQHRSANDVLLPRPYLEMNAADAAEQGLENDQFAVVRINGERLKVAIHVVPGPSRGVGFLSAGANGPVDVGTLDGAILVDLEPLAERVPNQGEVLVETGPTGSEETH